MLNKLKKTWRRMLGDHPLLPREPPPVVALDGRYRASAHVAAEALGEELVLVHLGRGSTYRLNRTGKRVWELIQQGISAKEIVVQLQAAWSVPAERLEADVRQILSDLLREQLLENAE